MNLQNYELKVRLRIWKIFTIFNIFVVLSSIECRRYNIEEECKRIYKEDLRTVLERFRRSPEYLRILEAKAKELAYDRNGILMEVYAYHTDQDRLEAAVAKALNIQVSKEPTTTDCSKKRFKSRRQEEEEEDDEIPEQIKNLDYYVQGKDKPLTASDLNIIKNLAFEITGKIIHDIIKGFSNDEEEAKSTRVMMMVDPDDKQKKISTTTEHCSIHTVSSRTSTTFLPPAARVGPELQHEFLYKPAADGNTEPSGGNGNVDIVDDERSTVR